MIHKIKNKKGELSFVVVGVFGQNAARVLDQSQVTRKEFKAAMDLGGARMRREFNTPQEAMAYQAGLFDMDGWHECCITSWEKYKRVVQEESEHGEELIETIK